MAPSTRTNSRVFSVFPRVALALGVALAPPLTGCGAANTGAEGAEFPPMAKRWFDRATASYRAGDIDDAQISIDNALRVAPKHEEVKLLAARVALAQLEYARTLQLLEGATDLEAVGLRGRAHWYAGNVEKAADELELLLSDPEVRDPWAKEVAKLARRGTGRRPFKVSGGLLAAVEMPQVSATWMVVPVELNGEPALGVIATAVAETLIDSSSGAEAQWINLRFGERIEVRDVPALPKDLSGISRQLNAPIKLLLGVNLLRHLHPTMDFMGGQFVVRTFDPPPPPAATTVRINYVRGGGMLLRGAFGTGDAAPAASLMIDTSMAFPVALADRGFQKAGIKLGSLQAVPGGGKLKQGVLPMLRVGAFEIPQVPALHGVPVQQMSDELKMDLDGVVGSGLFAPFRVTLVDRGRTLWLEDLPAEAVEQLRGPQRAEPEEDGGETAPSASDTPAPASSGAAPAPKKPEAAPAAPKKPASASGNPPPAAP